MKKSLLYGLVALLLLVTVMQPTVKVSAAEEKTASLDGIFFRTGKGWAVVFSITGKWRQGDLRGNTLTVDGHTFNLYCSFRDPSHISCTMVSLAPWIGMNATIQFGGWTFAGIIPDRVSGDAGFAECPEGAYETVHIRAYDGEGNVYNGSIGYPAELYTIEEAAAMWVALTEQAFQVEIVSYTITGVTCDAGEIER